MQYGFVNSTTGHIYVADSRFAAEAHAGAMGLTRFTVREVVTCDDSTTYEMPRTRRSQASPDTEMDAFLAGGQ
jgi:hypothetical protein